MQDYFLYSIYTPFPPNATKSVLISEFLDIKSFGQRPKSGETSKLSFLIILKVSLEFLVTKGLRAVRATIKLHSKSKIVSYFMITLILLCLAKSFRENVFCTPYVMLHYHYCE